MESYDGQPFLSEPGNFALVINMDFFQPYKHVQYSVGAIYLRILNLPRGIRNKAENVILVGLIPGPHKLQHDINTFLEPLVTDLLSLWILIYILIMPGIPFAVPYSVLPVTFLRVGRHVDS